MKKLKLVINLIKYNLKSLVLFELIFKLLSFLIFVPIFLNIFNLIMKITGYNYLTLENIFSFLKNPITILMLLILILLMMVYAMFDIITIIVILNQSYKKTKIKVIQAIRVSLNKCKKLFSIKNIPLSFLVLFLIPFLNIGISSSFISTIKIPEFILDFVLNNRLLLILFSVIIIFLISILHRWIYSVHSMVLEDVSFKEARKTSSLLSSKNCFKDLISILLVQLTLYFLYIIVIALGILIITSLNKIKYSIVIIKSITATSIWLFIVISFIVVTLLSTPLSYACISILYYIRKEELGVKIPSLKIKYNKENENLDRKIRKVIIFIYFLALIFGSIFTYNIYKGNYNINIEYANNILVTAHRGASLDCPENTFSAFVSAKNYGADFIEIDVQETIDGKIIVIHDKNFKRTTGINKHTWETSYDEVKNFDAGSFMNESFKDERIPLFEDVVLWAKNNNINLNIEIKPTGYEKKLVENVIDIVNKFGFQKECVLTSQNYEVLEKIKAYDDEITTGYVMSFVYGDLSIFDKADSFSIEEASITSSLVKEVHNQGKEIYAWTVNNSSNVQKMIDLKVDNIITDDVLMTKEIIFSNKTSNIINEYVKYIENIFG